MEQAPELASGVQAADHLDHAPPVEEPRVLEPPRRELGDPPDAPAVGGHAAGRPLHLGHEPRPRRRARSRPDDPRHRQGHGQPGLATCAFGLLHVAHAEQCVHAFRVYAVQDVVAQAQTAPAKVAASLLGEHVRRLQ
eukprot:3449924-Pyramimonas_sp.AAC.1